MTLGGIELARSLGGDTGRATGLPSTNQRPPVAHPARPGTSDQSAGRLGVRAHPTSPRAPPQDDAPGDDASPRKVTGSVGGVWEKPGAEAKLETHKPAVGTWGVFERPKDISKAYGGGRDPTVSRTSPSEMRRKDAETQALLAR